MKRRLTEAPVIVLGHLTEAQRRAYRIAENKLTELGTWNEALLLAELNDLLAEDFDLSLVGFSDGELDKLLAYVPEGEGEESGGANVPPVVLPEPPRNPASRTGDLWILGKPSAGNRKTADLTHASRMWMTSTPRDHKDGAITLANTPVNGLLAPSLKGLLKGGAHCPVGNIMEIQPIAVPSAQRLDEEVPGGDLEDQRFGRCGFGFGRDGHDLVSDQG
jgi:hypothetical protein